ncbi:MAG: cell division topological specificity factor MinE [Campylobacterales bacterium]|uniref:Cell division topological specificity factor n=1 Tax=Sulfurospirillum barnesii (strain ATCC 700032 / DSM 10660 / SES-3) TaxID=760154 RepID=I3XWA3_SULBS|nr:cell division topological specificity factor MinE [Sulfurospirillum barnesii]AFL68227.1 cell division topological specificity factor MinE [Sulfurospirillum barnesii SES-3]MBN1839036.1 cell division topological specificity factor MinE [Campylobacterales bacterium]MBN2832782.1 cell division topological specificity factor MinE [Campylobacterales bacterium]
MSLFDTFFGKKKSTADVAKNRLTIMLSHERASCKLPYLDDLRNDLINVIKKYTKVEDVKITSHNNQNLELLEVEVILGK